MWKTENAEEALKSQVKTAINIRETSIRYAESKNRGESVEHYRKAIEHLRALHLGCTVVGNHDGDMIAGTLHRGKYGSFIADGSRIFLDTGEGDKPVEIYLEDIIEVLD